MRRVVRKHEGERPSFAIEEAPLPPLREDGVLVRVRRSLVWESARGKRPFWACGEACAGTVVATGLAQDLPSPGARVACAGAAFAGHAEHVSAPRHLIVRVPERLSWDEACLAAPGAVALHALRRSGATLGEWVAVAGEGLVALLALEIARASGFRTIGLAASEAGAARARSLGAEAAFLLGEKTGEEVLALTRGRGADRLLVTGSVSPLALRVLSKNGRAVLLDGGSLDGASPAGEIEVVLAGSPGPGFEDARYEEAGIDLPIAHVRWTENRNMAEVLRLVAQKKINVSALLGDAVPLEDAPRALEKQDEVPCPLLDFPERESAPLDRLPGSPAPIALAVSAKTTFPGWAEKLRSELEKRPGPVFLTCRASGEAEPHLALLAYLSLDPKPPSVVESKSGAASACLLRFGNGAVASLVRDERARFRLEAFKGGAAFLQEAERPLEAFGRDG